MADEAREIKSPFAFIGPGGQDVEDQLYDFSPRVEKAADEEEAEGDPKDLFAPGSAESSDLAPSAPQGRTVPHPSTPRTMEGVVGLEDVEKGNTPPREYEPSSSPIS